MKNRDAFSGCHPVVNFLYFAMVLVFAMCFLHPVCLGMSLVSALAYSIYLKGGKAVRFAVLYMLPMMVLAAVLNPAFNHGGVTILAYLPDGNPLTLESILYGLDSAVLLVGVIVWFTCFNEVMTSDKFVYLFGRIIPALSLVISMILRFVPRFVEQTRTISQSQKCIGRDASTGSVWQRLRNGATILSIMVTWALENAIEYADSMNSRGYGLPGRTAFSIYRIDERDKHMLLWLGFCGVYIISGWITGAFYWRFIPSIKHVEITPFTLSFMLVYLLLCLTPLILNVKEDNTWKHLRSGI